MEINTQSIDNPYGNDYNYMNLWGSNKYGDNNDVFPLSLSNSQNFIKNSVDFENAWNPIIAARENNFVSQLDAWKTKYNLTIVDDAKVFVFGENIKQLIEKLVVWKSNRYHFLII